MTLASRGLIPNAVERLAVRGSPTTGKRTKISFSPLARRRIPMS